VAKGVCDNRGVMGKIVFSGIQPSGNLHLGNYIGAIKQWVSGQDEGTNIYCVVDLHAITVPQDPQALREKTLEVAGLMVACGLDPSKVILFVQSHNSDHANLGWVLNCFLSMGQMNRMTQFKEKSTDKEFVSVGLFDYPALMAADILLYGTTEVPVGEDQRQHVELARDVAERFNGKFGETFVIPEPVIPKIGGRVMSLSNPTKKMSKSDSDPMGAVGLLDDKETILKKFKSAVTDSGSEIKYDEENKPGVANLLSIYSLIKGVSVEAAEKEFAGKGYGEFKSAVGEMVADKLLPIQKRYKELRETKELENIFEDGAKKSRELSGVILKQVYEKVGFAI